ncbi:MAG: hypothetical protein ACLRQF_20270 [Thomasclavelia ramosa]
MQIKSVQQLREVQFYTGFKEGVIGPNTYFVDEPIKIKGTKAKKS